MEMGRAMTESTEIGNSWQRRLMALRTVCRAAVDEIGSKGESCLLAACAFLSEENAAGCGEQLN